MWKVFSRYMVSLQNHSVLKLICRYSNMRLGIIKNRNFPLAKRVHLSLCLGLIFPDARVPPLSVFSLHLFNFLLWSCIRTRRGDRWHFLELSSTMHPLWSPATMTFSWSFPQRGLLLYLLSYRRITGCGSPPPPPVSSPERLRPLSPCTDYSRYLIKHLDPPRSPQRATVPPLTHFPPYCVKLWKGVKQNKEGPLKDVATGT